MTDIQFDEISLAAITDELKNFAELARGVVPDGPTGAMVNRHEQYWKFCTNEMCQKPGHVDRRGWIVVGPSLKTNKGAMDYEEFRVSKHAEPLPQYGQFECGGELTSNWTPQNPFGRFTPLVTSPGGIQEFPASQITEYGWHRNPIIRKARPDVAGTIDYPCPFGCRNRLFASQDAQKQHIEAAHEKQMVSTALGEQISIPMTKITELIAQQSNHGFSVEQAMIMATAIVQALKNENVATHVPEDEKPEVVESEEKELGIPLLSKEELRKPVGRGARI